MREPVFIKRNHQKWKAIESNDKKTADDLADNFIELTNDLSYARTFYPGSPIEGYLNNLAAKSFVNIYKHKRKSFNVLNFWTEDLPLLFYKYRKQILYSFIAFTLGILLGITSAGMDDTFVRLILGDSYVDTTLRNIENDDPMAIYKQTESSSMFFLISTNNIRVAFFAFVLGIFFSIGTIWVLFFNGVMLGAFQYFFYEKGLLFTSMKSVWLHGTLEIWAIIVAGACGLIIGNSLLFPDTYSRKYALQKVAPDAARIVVSLVPIFIVAALIESYLTRLTWMPAIFNLLVIGLSLAFIIYYYIIYPLIIFKLKTTKL